MTAHELTSNENTSRRFETTDDVRRRAAAYVARARLRGARAVPDEAAVAELLEILGLQDVTR